MDRLHLQQTPVEIKLMQPHQTPWQNQTTYVFINFYIYTYTCIYIKQPRESKQTTQDLDGTWAQKHEIETGKGEDKDHEAHQARGEAELEIAMDYEQNCKGIASSALLV